MDDTRIVWKRKRAARWRGSNVANVEPIWRTKVQKEGLEILNIGAGEREPRSVEATRRAAAFDYKFATALSSSWSGQRQ